MKFHQWLKRHADLLGAYSSLTVIVLAPTVFIGGLASYVQFSDALEKPDVVIRFTGHDEPRFWVENTSAKLANNALYELRIFNLDLVGSGGLPLHLPMPVQSIDYVRPGRGYGPYTLRSLATNGSVFQKGHRLFGHATIQCETCPTVHDYWIFVQIGTSGWYAEIPLGEVQGVAEEVLAMTHKGVIPIDVALGELVPLDRRIELME